MSLRIISLFFLILCTTCCTTAPTPTFELTTSSNPQEGGTVSPSSGEYDEGSPESLTATPNQGYLFDSWSASASGNQNPLSVTFNSDQKIIANFLKRDYPLTVEIHGEGVVTESLVQKKSTNYEYGTTVQLTANANEGWQFLEWQGDLTGDEKTVQVTVDQEKSVTAVFKRQLFELNISTEGSGTASFILISGNQIGSEYEYESQIELTATPSEGSKFIGWIGDVQNSDNPLTILISQEISIIAEFEEFSDSPFANGDGSESYPFEVETLEQLQEIRNYPGKHFIQVNDINASKTKSWNGGEGFRPIGDRVIPFTGTYDGSNKIIDGLYFNRNGESYIGFFGLIEDAIIENLTLSNFFISANTYTGGIAGRSNSSIIRNSHAEGEIKDGSYYTGGIAGSNDTNSLIENSSANIQLTGSGQMGGVAGGNFGLIKKSYSTGTIETPYDNTGGLVGLNYGDVEQSYSTVSVTGGRDNIGGLVGQNDSDGKIENSYATGNVTGDVAIGGLVGLNDDRGEIVNSFAVGMVSGNEDVGGLIGLNGASARSSYWDTQSSNKSNGVGRGNSDGVGGLTTTQVTGTNAEENLSGFDWTTIWETTNTYPVLRWED